MSLSELSRANSLSTSNHSEGVIGLRKYQQRPTLRLVWDDFGFGFLLGKAGNRIEHGEAGSGKPAWGSFSLLRLVGVLTLPLELEKITSLIPRIKSQTHLYILSFAKLSEGPPAL